MGNELILRYMLKPKRSKEVSGKQKVSVSGGFGILLAVLLFLDEQNIVPWALLACFLHELGHLFVIYLLGGTVQAFHLSIIGAEMIPARKRLFSYTEELMIAAGGPVMSFVCALLIAFFAKRYGGSETIFLFSGLNLVAGLFNLLPVGPLDGGRILKILLLKRSFQEGERLYQFISALLSVAMIWLGFFHVFQLGGNVTLLLTGIWLLIGVRRNQT
jgi:stage IV sporulation protein FB